MRSLCLFLMLAPGMAAAWERLDEPGIRAALAGRLLVFDAYTFQTFDENGRTQFVTERAADGFWSVRDDRYCSVWPPSDVRTCYDVDREGERIRFTHDDGSASIGTYAPE